MCISLSCVSLNINFGIFSQRMLTRDWFPLFIGEFSPFFMFLLPHLNNYTFLVYLRNKVTLGRVRCDPDDWKRGRILPILKKDRKEDPGSYHLANFTSVSEKVMEQMLLEAMLGHIEDRKVTWDSQHDFTQCRSCLIKWPSVLEWLHQWTREAIDVIYLDLWHGPPQHPSL